MARKKLKGEGKKIDEKSIQNAITLLREIAEEKKSGLVIIQQFTDIVDKKKGSGVQSAGPIFGHAFKKSTAIQSMVATLESMGISEMDMMMYIALK